MGRHLVSIRLRQPMRRKILTSCVKGGKSSRTRSSILTSMAKLTLTKLSAHDWMVWFLLITNYCLNQNAVFTVYTKACCSHLISEAIDPTWCSNYVERTIWVQNQNLIARLSWVSEADNLSCLTQKHFHRIWLIAANADMPVRSASVSIAYLRWNQDFQPSHTIKKDFAWKRKNNP